VLVQRSFILEKKDRFVYLMRAGENHYKVGIAQDVMRRVSAVQTGNPSKVELVVAVFISDAHITENQLHKWLEDYKALGGREWFELDPSKVIELITRMTELSIYADVTKYLRIRNLIARQTKLENIVANLLEKLGQEKEETKRAEKIISKEHDELFDDAIDAFKLSNRASVSFLQRKFRIGYSRAARLMDELELAGVVSRSDGAKPRQLMR
jgi:DNA segregation ATPase FtsK/SpoIIIE-like protein